MSEPARLKVLLLDDNAIDRETCRRHLNRVESTIYESVEHNSIDGALELVEQVQPDCIILDYHLHDGTGLDFLRSLGSIGGPMRFPVVMLTGTGSERIAVEVMKTGAQDYISKDRLSPEILERTIENAVYRAGTERTLEEQRQEMKRLYGEAQLANARKDEFLATLSHELRTPLTPILTAVSQSDLSHFTRDDFIETFALIRRNIELEARLIDDLLDLTRIARGKLEIHERETNLAEVLQHAAESIEADRTNKWIQLEIRLPENLPPIQGDPARLQQVFWNLLKNAVKFTPQDGSIEVIGRLEEGRIIIEVKDTGVGLENGTEEKIFAAFEQGAAGITKRYGGLGLGLAIARALVTAHEGRISAGNRSDRTGAVFTVELPLGKAAPPGVVSTPAVAAEPSHSDEGATILLVEDHRDSGILLQRVLARSGYRVFFASSIADGMEIFRSNHIDYVISDLGLPDGSGNDLMKQIMAIRPVPSIALSGYGMEEDIERSRAAGFTKHLTKPVDTFQIFNALKMLSRPPAAGG